MAGIAGLLSARRVTGAGLASGRRGDAYVAGASRMLLLTSSRQAANVPDAVYVGRSVRSQDEVDDDLPCHTNNLLGACHTRIRKK
jgi:hypothetical protein